MCEMVGAVDASRLGNHLAHLSLEELGSIDDALGLVLELQ
jgi:mRNA-degrading endonuclease toxin of MazEF toxin-antitoxin module